MSNTVMLPIMETTTQETQCLPANAKVKLGKISLLTASACGKAGAQARVARQLADKQALREAQAKLALLQPLIDKAAAQSLSIALEPDEEYRLRSLKRVRAQVEMLEAKLDECDEPRDLKAIADAIARLRDCEQNLAGRPSPGSRRPGREKPAKTDASGTAPID